MKLDKTDNFSLTSLFSRVRFVMVNTSSPGNVGSAARAIKTMGFSELVLVNPRVPNPTQEPEAIAFASNASDVLNATRIVETVDEALEGCQYAVAVSARLREFSPPVFAPRPLAEKLAADPSLKIALIFGNERFGLPNEVVQKCQVLVNIPANPDYSSLNLSQAVQVIAYELRMAQLAISDQTTLVHPEEQHPEIGFQGHAAGVEEIEGMFQHLEEGLVAINFLNPNHPKKLMPRLKRMFARAQLEAEEVNILRGIAKQMISSQSKQSK